MINKIKARMSLFKKEFNVVFMSEKSDDQSFQMKSFVAILVIIKSHLSLSSFGQSFKLYVYKKSLSLEFD
jgi:hypothetical protein